MELFAKLFSSLLVFVFHCFDRVVSHAHERSVGYPEGRRNVMFARRGIRPLGRMKTMPADSAPAPVPDTQMLYRYPRQCNGVANSHASGTDMGADWRDNDTAVQPEVEIYQGDGQNYGLPDARRTNSAGDSIGGWRPPGFVSLALDRGYRLGFQASSDHIPAHMPYANAWVREKPRPCSRPDCEARRTSPAPLASPGATTRP